ncbi:MAG: mechanosensitive ion channel [Aphanocapsa sp. GSE-SYN-MK-11-07L]|jgi:small-conductance mechanosensitive channel|nr:mechanosensitive ion channel [Aphanocapsa sp. GSE-SYN-MK-11-07L]
MRLPLTFAFLDYFSQVTLFKIGSQTITLLWVLRLILIFVLLVGAVTLLKRLLKERLLVKLGISPGHREVISTLVSYLLGALSFVLLLQAYGIDIISLTVVLGGLGVGIGFGLQEITKNLVSGITLLLEGKLQVGDFVEFNEISGYIKEISLRSTIIRTFDGGDIVVPNSNLTANQVLNWSYKNFTGKLRLPIGVAYESDPVLVVETLLNSAYMQSAVLQDPPPKVNFKGFGDNALNFELWVWVSRIDEGLLVRSALNFIIDYNFRRAGIRMPYPQRDLWLRNPETLIPPPVQTVLAQDQLPGVPTMLAQPASSSLGDLLRQVPYFRSCSDLNLLEIIEAGYRKTLPESEMLFQEGETGTAMYILLSGKIESFSRQLNQKIRTYGPGDFFGEVPIMLGVPYLSSTQAIELTSLFVIPKQNLERLLRSRPFVAEVLAQEMAREKEFYSPIRQQLEDLGLLDMNRNGNDLVAWLRTRLQKLFSI